MNIKKRRNGNIEILRFLFSMAVVGLHGGFGVKGGYLGVEFFFMLTGAYMAKEIDNDNMTYTTESFTATCIASLSYIKGKIKKIYPSFLLSSLIGILVFEVSGNKDIGLGAIVGDALFLQNYGYPVISATGVLWYLSALFFGIWFLYPVLRRHYIVYSEYFALIVYFLISGYLINKRGTMEVPCEFFGPINSGFLRAIGGLSIGVVSYEVSKKIGDLNEKLNKIYWLDFFESLGWFCVFTYMISRIDEKGLFDGVIVLAMGVTLGISLSQTTIISRLLQRSAATLFLGKFSSVVFMNHLYWFNCIRDISVLDKNVNEMSMKVIALVLSIITTLVVIILERPMTNIMFFIKKRVFGTCAL